MLVSADSPLRRVRNDIPVTTVFFLDGCRYAIEMTDLAFRRLEATIAAFDSRPDALGPQIVCAISDAWVIVDSVHRLRELVQHFPGLKKREPEVQIFLRSTKELDDLRNFVQHFRTEITRFAERRMPLWGTLSWSHADGEPTTHTIIPGTFYSDVGVASCVFDSQEGRFTEQMVLHAGPRRVELVEVFTAVKRFFAWFEEWCKATHSSSDARHGADAHIVFTVLRVERPAPDRTSPAEPPAPGGLVV